MKALLQAAGLVTALWGFCTPLAEPWGFSSLIAAPVKAPPKNAGLQKLFRRGMDAYEARSYDDAVDLFSQLLQKQPDYLPAKIQLARTLYQLKRPQDAYKLFQQIEDVSILEPDPSYEYGQSAFRANDYANALKAFRNVPNGHPLFDLAGYYGGISAFKQGEYQLALDLFEQAVVLPSKLLKSQKLYQKEAERLSMQQQKQELQNTVPPVGARPNAEEPPEPPKPFRFLSATRGLSLMPRFTSQTQEIIDKETRVDQIKAGNLLLSLGLERGGSVPKAAHWVFQTDLSAQAFEGTSREILAIPTPDEEQERFIIRKSLPRSLFSLDAAARIEWNIATGTSLGLSLGARALAPGESDEPKGAAIPQIGVFLAQKNNNLETLFKTDFYGFVYDGDMLFSNARQIGRIDYVAQNKIRFGLQGELSEYAYNVDRVDGPDWQGRILTEIGYGNDQGFRVMLGAFFEITEAQRFHDLGDVSIIEFNNSSAGARLSAGYDLFRFVDLGVDAWAMNRSTSALNQSDDDAAQLKALHTAFPSTVSTLTLHVNIHTGF